MSDQQTLAVYDTQADAYADMMRTSAEADVIWKDFVAACPADGTILDLGCGPGNYAALFAVAGLKVIALDASAEMARRAGAIEGVSARHGFFEDVTEVNAYDGIWASFSLLHAPRAAFPRHLSALHRALKPAGAFFIGMKTGTGSGRDDLGRFYEYYTLEELQQYLRDAGFEPQRHWTGYGKGLAGQYSGWAVVQAHA